MMRDKSPISKFVTFLDSAKVSNVQAKKIESWPDPDDPYNVFLA